MTNRWKKITLGAVIVGCALGYLFWSGLSDAMVATRTVSEYLEAGSGRSRVSGVVMESSVSRLEDGSLRFVMADEGGELSVLYRDTVPDMFAEGRPVIVEGASMEGGEFHADTLLTKCPSKYEGAPEDGHESGDADAGDQAPLSPTA